MEMYCWVTVAESSSYFGVTAVKMNFIKKIGKGEDFSVDDFSYEVFDAVLM